MTGIVVFAAAFLLYFHTAVPVFFFEDNAEFTTAAYTLGLTHFPGYPLISSVANIAGLLPLGGFGFRCNIFSSFIGALAVYFFFRCSLEMTGGKKASLAAATVFALSGNLWTQTAILKVYSIHYALIFGLLWMALAGKLSDFRWLLFSSFLFGIGVANHLSFSLMLIPVCIIWISQRGTWQYRLTAGRAALLPLAGLFSWITQLYILARSNSPAAGIFFSWGRVTETGTFLKSITGLAYASLPFNKEPWGMRFAAYAGYLESAMPLWAWIIAGVSATAGALVLFRNAKPRLAALLAGAALFSGYTLLHGAAVDIMHVPPWGFVILLAGCAIAKLPPPARHSAPAAVAALAVLVASARFGGYDYHRDYTAYDYMADITDTVPQRGKLGLTAGKLENFLIQYAELGPARMSWPKGDGDIYTPYLTPTIPANATYGLLNTFSADGRNEWPGTRSYPPPEDFVPPPGSRLARYAPKAYTFAGIHLQRGYYELGMGHVQAATASFSRAAAMYPGRVKEDAAIMNNRGDTAKALMLMEEVYKNDPSPENVSILLRLRQGVPQ